MRGHAPFTEVLVYAHVHQKAFSNCKCCLVQRCTAEAFCAQPLEARVEQSSTPEQRRHVAGQGVAQGTFAISSLLSPGRDRVRQKPSSSVLDCASRARVLTMPAACRKDFYHILGVQKDADDKILKKAYRKLALKYHPVRIPGPLGAS